MVLPLDVWQRVFSNLALRDLRICMRVSQLWNQAIGSDSAAGRVLWYQLSQRDFDVLVGNFNFNPEANYKSFYKSLLLSFRQKTLIPLIKKAEADLTKARAAGVPQSEVAAGYDKAIKNLETALKIQTQLKGDTTALTAIIADLKQELLIPRILQEASLYIPSEEEVAEFKQAIELYQDQDDPFACWAEYIKAFEAEGLPLHLHFLAAALCEHQKDFSSAIGHYLELAQHHPQPLACLKKAVIFVQKASDPFAYPHFLEKLDRNILLKQDDPFLKNLLLQKDAIRMEFEKILAQFKTSVSQQSRPSPTCFICFALEPTITSWLKKTFVPDIEKTGIQPLFSPWHLDHGMDLNAFQAKIRSASLVLVICTPLLREICKKRLEDQTHAITGSAQEIRVAQERFNDQDKNNTISLVYLKGKKEESIPTPLLEPNFYARFTILDQSSEADLFSYYSKVFRLLASLKGFKEPSWRGKNPSHPPPETDSRKNTPILGDFGRASSSEGGSSKNPPIFDMPESSRLADQIQKAFLEKIKEILNGQINQQEVDQWRKGLETRFF